MHNKHMNFSVICESSLQCLLVCGCMYIRHLLVCADIWGSHRRCTTATTTLRKRQQRYILPFRVCLSVRDGSCVLVDTCMHIMPHTQSVTQLSVSQLIKICRERVCVCLRVYILRMLHTLHACLIVSALSYQLASAWSSLYFLTQPTWAALMTLPCSV